MLDRRQFGLVLAASALPANAEVLSPDIRAEQDFDELWETLAARYCFFAEKATDWARVRRTYRPLAIRAETEAGFIEVLRRTLSELYDPHTRLAETPVGAPRFPPFDIWSEWRGADAVIFDVEAGSAAAAAGLAPGDRILAVDGRRTVDAAAALRPVCLHKPDPAAETWALQSAVAGRRGSGRTLLVRTGSDPARTVTLTRPTAAAPPATVSDEGLPDGFGRIPISSFGDAGAVDAFDQALLRLRESRGLLLDVRRNGGGDTAVGRPIMGRFVERRSAYAKMRRRDGAGLGSLWTEFVEPRGPFTYDRPVVVLIDRWSASMAEGFAMGMRAIAGAALVGTEMMQLGAAVFQLRLDRTGVQAQYSAEPVHTVTGAPRWTLRPDVAVTPTRGGGDLVLDAGLAELRRRAG